MPQRRNQSQPLLIIRQAEERASGVMGGGVFKVHPAKRTTGAPGTERDPGDDYRGQ